MSFSYAADTGTFSARPRRLGQLLLISFGVASAAFAYSKYPLSEATDAARLGSAVRLSQQPAALARSEPARKRSFTPTRTAEQPSADAEAKPVHPEAAPPQAAAAARLEIVTLPEPAATGALAHASRKPDEIDRRAATATKHQGPHHVPSSGAARRSAEMPQARHPRREARRSNGAQPASEFASLSAPAASRRQHAAVQPAAASGQRVAAAGPRKTASVCLYFVLCF